MLGLLVAFFNLSELIVLAILECCRELCLLSVFIFYYPAIVLPAFNKFVVKFSLLPDNKLVMLDKFIVKIIHQIIATQKTAIEANAI